VPSLWVGWVSARPFTPSDENGYFAITKRLRLSTRRMLTGTFVR
jgi:hypothetical protein